MSQHRKLDAWTYSQECFKVLQAYRLGHITSQEQQEEFALLRMMMFGLQGLESLYIGGQQDRHSQQA